MPNFVILARGGSVGVPGKNVMQFGGQPLIALAIDKCFRAYPDCRVVVSTDDSAIASIALDHAADVVNRPDHLSTSEATAWEALRHAVDAAHLNGTIGLIQCTNPFTTPGDLIGTVNACKDMAVCVEETHELLFDSGGNAVNWDITKTLRQQREKQYRIVGSVWAFRPGYVQDCECYTGSIGLHVAESQFQVDIDTPADVAVAKTLYEGEARWIPTN